MTIQEFGAKLRARDDHVRGHRRAVPGADRGAQSGDQRVHPGDGGRGAAAGARGRPRARGGPRPRSAARGAALDQGPDGRARHRNDGGVARPRGAGGLSGRAVRRQPAGGGRRLRRQDQPARVRPRDHERRLGVRGRPQPARPHAVAGRFERRASPAYSPLPRSPPISGGAMRTVTAPIVSVPSPSAWMS